MYVNMTVAVLGSPFQHLLRLESHLLLSIGVYTPLFCKSIVNKTTPFLPIKFLKLLVPCPVSWYPLLSQMFLFPRFSPQRLL